MINYINTAQRRKQHALIAYIANYQLCFRGLDPLDQEFMATGVAFFEPLNERSSS